MGMGIGIIITCVLLLPFYQKEASPRDIEQKAREMGMIYADDIKALTGDMEGGKDQ